MLNFLVFAVLGLGGEGVQDGMDRGFVRVAYEAAEGVPTDRDLVVLSIRSAGIDGRDQDRAEEKEALKKHGGSSEGRDPTRRVLW
jgi:hypothetical protein